MMATLRRVASAFAKSIAKVLYPRIAEFAKPEDEEKHADAKEDEAVRSLMHELRDTAERSFDVGAFIASATTAASRTVTHSKREFQRIGIKLPKEPGLKPLISGWRRDSVERIRGMQADQLDKIERLLSEGFGMRAETLESEIRRQVEDVAESRARLIAVDQTLTLNARITIGRQAAAGIERFAWTTSGDERVRESHAELDGQVFSYDDPPEVDGVKALPGEPVLCRCVPFPIVPELED